MVPHIDTTTYYSVWGVIKHWFADRLPKKPPIRTTEIGIDILKDTFIGIVSGPSDNSVSIGILKTSDQTITAQSFLIEPMDIESYFFISQHGPPRIKDLPDLRDIKSFLDTNILNPNRVQVLIELPTIGSLSLDGAQPLPCALLSKDSIYLKVLAVLVTKGCIIWMDLPTQQNNVVLTAIPNRPELAHLKSQQLRFLRQGVADAFADFLLGTCPSTEHTSAMAALLAKNKGAYYYWSSFGRVFSSQDVVVFMQNYAANLLSSLPATRVVSGDEAFLITPRCEGSRAKNFRRLQEETKATSLKLTDQRG
jgi:hypothetical protein